MSICFDGWVMAKWLENWLQQWAVGVSLTFWGPQFATGIHLMKQFAQNWYLLWCQCTETCYHFSSIQHDIYIPVSGVRRSGENRSCPKSTRCWMQFAAQQVPICFEIRACLHVLWVLPQPVMTQTNGKAWSRTWWQRILMHLRSVAAKIRMAFLSSKSCMSLMAFIIYFPWSRNTSAFLHQLLNCLSIKVVHTGDYWDFTTDNRILQMNAAL